MTRTSRMMLTLQIGTCLAQNWDVAGAQLIYVLLYFILLTYCERNRWSVDRYIKQLKEGNQPKKNSERVAAERQTIDRVRRLPRSLTRS
jgi:hypothetical protein